MVRPRVPGDSSLALRRGIGQTPGAAAFGAGGAAVGVGLAARKVVRALDAAAMGEKHSANLARATLKLCPETPAAPGESDSKGDSSQSISDTMCAENRPDLEHEHLSAEQEKGDAGDSRNPEPERIASPTKIERETWRQRRFWSLCPAVGVSDRREGANDSAAAVAHLSMKMDEPVGLHDCDGGDVGNRQALPHSGQVVQPSGSGGMPRSA